MPAHLHKLWLSRQALIRRYKRRAGCQWREPLAACCVHNPYALELHAPDGHNERRIGQMLLLSIDRIKDELRRCVVLCGHHHDIITECNKSNTPLPPAAVEAEKRLCLGGPRESI